MGHRLDATRPARSGAPDLHLTIVWVALFGSERPPPCGSEIKTVNTTSESGDHKTGFHLFAPTSWREARTQRYAGPFRNPTMF
jgi:hypothetical protein